MRLPMHVFGLARSEFFFLIQSLFTSNFACRFSRCSMTWFVIFGGIANYTRQRFIETSFISQSRSRVHSRWRYGKFVWKFLPICRFILYAAKHLKPWLIPAGLYLTNEAAHVYRYALLPQVLHRYSKVNYKQLRHTSHYAALTCQPLPSFGNFLISAKSCLSWCCFLLQDSKSELNLRILRSKRKCAALASRARY